MTISDYAFSYPLEQAMGKLRSLLPRVENKLDSGKLPHVTEAGRWQWLPYSESGRWDGDSWHHGSWTGGFLAGQLWQASAASPDDPEFARIALACSTALSIRADDRATHDVGFLLWPSAVLGAIMTGRNEMVDAGVRAARSLMSRRHPSGLIQSWGDLEDPRARGSSAIDTMMNLPLLWWAHEVGVDGAQDAAVAHARASARLYVRADGTTYHTVRVGEKGELLDRGTYQGYGPESCWSRGQAWAVHGFVDAYRATGDTAFRDLAERVIEAFLSRLPADSVAPWDFDDPDVGGAPRDASASAIVAAALLKLGRYESTPNERWLSEAARLVIGLVEHATDSASDGLLLRTTYSVPHRAGIDGAATWGDYFFLECLVSLAGVGTPLDPLLP